MLPAGAQTGSGVIVGLLLDACRPKKFPYTSRERPSLRITLPIFLPSPSGGVAGVDRSLAMVTLGQPFKAFTECVLAVAPFSPSPRAARVYLDADKLL
jgi:hypothetical protein